MEALKILHESKEIAEELTKHECVLCMRLFSDKDKAKVFTFTPDIELRIIWIKEEIGLLKFL